MASYVVNSVKVRRRSDDGVHRMIGDAPQLTRISDPDNSVTVLRNSFDLFSYLESGCLEPSKHIIIVVFLSAVRATYVKHPTLVKRQSFL